MSIVDRLTSVGNGGVFQLDPTDQAWYRFFRDYKDEIFANSGVKQISREGLYPYRFDIQSFLQSQGIDISLTWMVKDLNDITDETFTEDVVTELRIPNRTYIQKLYNTYVSVKGSGA